MVKCDDCGNEKVEEIRNGLYYYMCPTCVKLENAKPHKPNDICCPKCGCYDYEIVIISGDFTDEGIIHGMKMLDMYPLRPAEKFYCKGCGEPWVNPEFEKYLLQRNIKQAKFNDEKIEQDEN
jgi:hypothetical protein